VNLSLPLAVIIHGWLDNVNETWVKNTVQEYTTFVETNVCVVDWKRLAQTVPFVAANHCDKVAAHVADFLKYFNSAGIAYNQVTMVGFSYGAHIAGIAGIILKGQIQRIFALDPAGMFITTFAKRSKERRLDKASAQFVQAIHTEKYDIGTSLQLGHQDFYPSGGGSPQPACIIPIIQSGLDFCKLTVVTVYYVFY
jgi:pimeloyl-ACP methyl ester carboxylesterase